MTRAIEPNTPQLAGALANKTPIASVEFEFERDTKGGKEMYYKIKISDCRVSLHETFMASPEERARGWPIHLERVGFGYTKIEWNFSEPSTMGEFEFKPA